MTSPPAFPPPSAPDPDTATLRAMYEVMATIRACDERLRQALSSREVAVTYWPPSGQEAIAGGLSATLRADDRLVSTYRGLHDQLAKGAPLDEVVAEILCRRTGANKGKGGAMHVSHPESGLMLSTGIVGAGLPVAVGVALASHLRGDDRVTVVTFGDGAVNTGAFHEAMNLAAVWRLPVVFCCQNNGYAEMTPTSHGQLVERLSDRAAAYGMAGVTVDGNDPVAVLAGLGGAVEAARRGEGPAFVECVTFRLHGHYFGDTMAYMAAADLEAARADHPVDRYRSWLVERGVLADADAAAIEAAAIQAVEAAFAAALAAPEPDPAEALLDVYADRRGIPA